MENLSNIGFIFFNMLGHVLFTRVFPMSRAEAVLPPTPSSISPASPTASASGQKASIFILAVAAFVIVTTEFLIVGLLPALARDLSISISTAGQLVTLFAVVVMLLGPVLTAWLSHIERKRLFVAILLIFAGSNLLAALAPNLWVLALARLLGRRPD